MYLSVGRPSLLLLVVALETGNGNEGREKEGGLKRENIL